MREIDAIYNYLYTQYENNPNKKTEIEKILYEAEGIYCEAQKQFYILKDKLDLLINQKENA